MSHIAITSGAQADVVDPTAVSDRPAVSRPDAKDAAFLGLSRQTRVLSLLLAVVVMSLADLGMTLTHLTTIGMLEANPIARWIMQLQSPTLLVLWKLATLGVAGAILLKARRLACGEIAAWICTAILLWLMIRWSVYLDHIALLGSADLHAIAEGRLHTFVAVRP